MSDNPPCTTCGHLRQHHDTRPVIGAPVGCPLPCECVEYRPPNAITVAEQRARAIVEALFGANDDRPRPGNRLERLAP